MVCAHRTTFSTIDDRTTALIVLSERTHLLPNFAGLVVSVSFVCESKEGLTIRHETKIHRCCLQNKRRHETRKNEKKKRSLLQGGRYWEKQRNREIKDR